MVKFTVSLISFSSVNLFAFLIILTIVAIKCIEHIECAVINTLIPESDQHLISPFNIIPKLSIKVMGIKEMIIN